MEKILASDILVNDVKVDLPSAQSLDQLPQETQSKYLALNAEIDRLLALKGAERGSRVSLTAEEFSTLDSKLVGISSSSEPGGSSADILTTLKHLLNGNVAIDYLGVAGRGLNGNIIREDLKKTGINLVTADVPGSESALSLIFTEADGKRTMLTYPGNASQLMKPELINGVVEKNDATFLPLSLWAKFGEEYSNTLLDQTLKNDKLLIATLPKQARYNFDMPENAVQKVLQNADVVVGDAEELMRMYKTNGDFESAIGKLQDDIAKRDILRVKDGKPPRKNPVMAYITHQYKGATVISAGSQPKRFTVDIPEGGYTLGANDAGYAGFIAGSLNGLSPEASASLAVETAKTKLLYNQVRIPEPENDAETQKRWNNLRQGFFSGLTNELSLALTGVGTNTKQNLPRTFGQSAVDGLFYGLLFNAIVIAGSVFVTHKTTYGAEGNALRKRGDKSREWTAKKLSKFMDPDSSKKSADNFMMILWSFLDGSLIIPFVWAAEKFRNPIAKSVDKLSGTKPKDEAVYEQETKRDFKSVLKARASTAFIVISTALTLDRFGVNDKLLTEPGAKLGAKINKLDIIKTRFPKLTQQTVTNKEGKTFPFMEALGHMTVFELFYTSVCMAGLGVGGFIFSKRKQVKEEKKHKLTAETPKNNQEYKPDDKHLSEVSTKVENHSPTNAAQEKIHGSASLKSPRISSQALGFATREQGKNKEAASMSPV